MVDDTENTDNGDETDAQRRGRRNYEDIDWLREVGERDDQEVEVTIPMIGEPDIPVRNNTEDETDTSCDPD